MIGEKIDNISDKAFIIEITLHCFISLELMIL